MSARRPGARARGLGGALALAVAGSGLAGSVAPAEAGDTASHARRSAGTPSYDPVTSSAGTTSGQLAAASGGSPGIGKVLSGYWREPIANAGFEPLREAESERWVTRTRDQWVANMLSVSSIASLPDADRVDLAARLRELVPDGEYRWTIRTAVYWTCLV